MSTKHNTSWTVTIKNPLVRRVSEDYVVATVRKGKRYQREGEQL